MSQPTNLKRKRPTKPRDVWLNVSAVEASGQHKGLSARQAAAAVYTEHLTLTDEQKASLDQLYAPDGKPPQDREFALDNAAAQTEAAAFLASLRLDIVPESHGQLGSPWSVKWASRDGRRPTKSQKQTKRVLFQCDCGYDRKVVGVRRRHTTSETFDFTGCLAHAEVTYATVSGAVLRVRGIFEHNDACKTIQASVVHQHDWRPSTPLATSSTTSFFRLSQPLPQDAPSPAYEHSGQAASAAPNPAISTASLDNSCDILGDETCVICGTDIVETWCVISPSERKTWDDLRERGNVPANSTSAAHERRNTITLCPNHHKRLATYQAFIRFCPELNKYVFVNHSGAPAEAPFHGKAVALESHHANAPFPSLFLVHEYRVRGFFPFREPALDVALPVPWQDWLLARGVIDAKGDIRRERPAGTNMPTQSGASTPLPACSWLDLAPGCSPPGLYTIAPPTSDVAARIVAATHNLPTWTACELEGRDSEGLATRFTGHQQTITNDEAQCPTPDSVL
ncbi:uncharacterized protein C8Q71DRAFT_862657 [Rhodofomes roseus]|uniref:HNH nuclease domain-containing protein n=1 Tax=Rhodofomes roseus TaxID=34475 RepID=A0ABQ8K116_9APHY|nr:uncharacterized protein C8Q71DRAFT_862657 [Rhodofomes roseus]KAH9830367.1 hypothetical protein C8Q71DRAFT_862657 [Rhodofomes roseus]